ncbi:MAG: hypothetical protein M3082_16615 [Candidatus Dormibacteraeota bacterium]|nr:hypothetical protein [Candidatus Dormibacteraeota bacterium]
MSEEGPVRFRLVGAKSDDGPTFFKMEFPDGRSALVDKAYKDMVEGTRPPPSQASLDAIWRQAAAASIFDNWRGGLPAIFRGAELQDLRRWLVIGDAREELCTCHGEYEISVFDAVGVRIAGIGLHQGRWLDSDWDSHAELREPRAFVEWLADHGAEGPLNDILEADRKAVDQERTEAEWLASIPSSLASLGPRYLRYDRDMEMGPELEAETLRRLTEAIPNEAKRAGVLLRWFSVGNAEWPGQPAHEGIPGNLLLEMRTDRVVDFLAHGSPEERHWVGALRLITGWKFGARKRHDLLLTPIREGLLAAAQRLGDPVAIRQNREQIETLIPPN